MSCPHFSTFLCGQLSAMKIATILSLVVLLASCGNPTPAKEETGNDTPVEEKTDHFAELKQLMSGSFSSAEQAEADTSYFNISLEMHPIWAQLEDGSAYIYVEQALGTTLDKPYRQRIYELRQLSETEFVSYVYRLENQDTFVQKWNDPSYFNQFDKSILQEREGCEVYLTLQEDGSYSGSTGDKTCKSSMLGASYASSIVTVTQDAVVSWDRGFDAEDQYVWGAENGGYIFKRTK